MSQNFKIYINYISAKTWNFKYNVIYLQQINHIIVNIMTKRFIAATVFTLVCVMQICAQISVNGYSLVYSSETPERASSLLTLSEAELANCTGDFQSTENMERNWNYCTKASSVWNQRMGTTDEEHALVHKFENGQLKLYAKTTNGAASGFITGGIRMKKGYKYGIIEVKAKCNPHASNFPAIWMMPVFNDGWPQCGEIDIMEMVGNSSTVHSTVHVAARYPNDPNGHSVGKSYSWTNNKSTSAGYHIYSLYWDKNSLIFYCDGRQIFRYNKDTTLDFDAHPEYEKYQFPYNKEFELILNQSLGKNSGWGYENPDPTYTYEMDVEYVRIWQAPETYEVDKYYMLRNYDNNARFMSVNNEETLVTTDISEIKQANDSLLFGIAPADIHGRYYLVSKTGKAAGKSTSTTKAVPLSDEACHFYMLKDATKGFALDYAKETTPVTYSDGSRALTLNANKGNIVSISGNSKNSAWWSLVNPEDVLSGIESINPTNSSNGDGYIYTLSGQRLNKLQKGVNIVGKKKIAIK